MDFENQMQIEKPKNGERGVEIVTPFYTHLDKAGKVQGVLVNRGWMPWDLKDFRQDREVNQTQVTGVLYQGDNKTKYSKPNNPHKSFYRAAYPEELAVMANLPNKEASQFMVKAIDFDTECPTAMPDVASVDSLTKF